MRRCKDKRSVDSELETVSPDLCRLVWNMVECGLLLSPCGLEEASI